MIDLPTKWADLTPTQVSRVALYLNTKGERVEQMILLAADLGGLKIRGTRIAYNGQPLYWFFRRGTGNVLLDAEQVAMLVDHLKWVEGEISLMAAPFISGCTTPDHRLYGVGLEQFITAESAVNHFVKSRSMEALRVCAAALYPIGEFDPAKLQKQAQRLARFDDQLNGVLLWFLSAKKYLADRYPYVFSGQGEGEPQQGSDVLLSLLSSLNGGDTTKNSELKAGELHEALHELNLKIKAATTK